jgi:PAS domain S-box-containing protein
MICSCSIKDAADCCCRMIKNRDFFSLSRPWQLETGLAGYAMAFALVGLALWLRFLLDPWLSDRIPFAFFFVAVALTAWFGGYGPCLFAVFLGSVTCWLIVLEPQNSWRLSEPFQWIGLVTFAFTGLVIAAFSGRTRKVLEENRRRTKDAQQTLQALNESERRFRGFAEHTQDVQWIIHADRDELFHISPSFTTVYGRPTSELYEDFNRMTDYLEEADRGRFKAFLEKCKSGLVIEDYRIVRPDGSVAWIRRRGFPILNERGDLEYRAGISQDITEENRLGTERDRLLDSERVARQMAEQSNRLKDEFLANLSHELRSPLNAILGWMQVLRQTPPDTGVIAQAHQAIERNGQSLARLVEDLLDMNRIVSGKFRLDVQTVDLASIIREAVDSVIPAANAKAIRVEQVLNPLAGPVKGDPDRLQQVIWNLLSNAVKFTPKGGKVQVHLERVNSQCEISVSDTGRGIKAEFLPYVFDRFRQQDSTTARAEGGLGLGLAIVKELVQHHGGSVSARSDGEGKGSTFIVALPVAVRTQDPSFGYATDVPGQPGLSLNGIRILAVDDDPDSVNALRLILEEHGAQVDTAYSASRALEKIKVNPPDVLLSDIGMPGQDGYQLIDAVRKLPGHAARIPAIAVTAFARPEDRIAALRAGFNMHLAKPINTAELITIIVNYGRSR